MNKSVEAGLSMGTLGVAVVHAPAQVEWRVLVAGPLVYSPLPSPMALSRWCARWYTAALYTG